MSRTRTNSDHFFDLGFEQQPIGATAKKQPFFMQKPVVKFHSALNSIGKRDCSGIKPRRLDFGNISNDKPLGSSLMKNLKTTDLKKLFKGPNKKTQNGFFVSPKS